MAHLVIVDTCPVFSDIGPYFYILLKESKSQMLSGYRGTKGRAPALLHKYHHMSQEDLYRGWEQRKVGFLPANPPGFSTHELFSDGVAYPWAPSGHALPWWCQGIDVNGTEQAGRMIERARHYGWDMHRPYTSGSEAHHINFRTEPHLKGVKIKARIYRLRHTLPRS